jgi:predicted ferric reductase
MTFPAAFEIISFTLLPEKQFLNFFKNTGDDMYKKALLILIYFLSPLLLIYNLYFSDTEKYTDPALLAAMIFGACAYGWLMAEFLLIARIKLWERYFGQDFLFRFHAIMAMICVLFIALHKYIEQREAGETFSGLVGDISLGIFLFIGIMALLFMADSFIVAIPFLKKLRRYLERKQFALYESSIFVHNLVISAVIIMYAHVMIVSSSTKEMKFIYTIYFLAGMLFYIYHKIIKRFILSRNAFYVKSVTKESDSMWTMKLVPEIGEVFNFKPGQFGFIRLFGSEIPRQEHPFSFSSEPSHRKYLSVTIKELGNYTSMVKHVKEGCSAWVDAPYGRFSYVNFPWEKSVMLIAGGIGITPALSMLRHMHSQNPLFSVTLLWGMNSRHDIIHTDELKKMKSDMPNFNMVPVMFKDEEWDGERGVIDEEIIQRFIYKDKHNIENTGFYICGPSPMLKIVISALKSAGVKRNRIHYEKFVL